MNIFIHANDEQAKELEPGKFGEQNLYLVTSELPSDNEYKNYDAFIILKNFKDFKIDYFENKPVIINEVVHTLQELNLAENFHRMNGWPGFLQRQIWEVASNSPNSIKDLLASFDRKIYFVKDEPGFVSARVVSMIVNEAFFALDENISTKTEIDLAMKTGTNYPFVPFEWAEKIGIENILKLLERLSETEERYLPARALKEFFPKSKMN